MATITIKEIKERVASIKDDAVWDREKAHATEDIMYIETLQAIANGAKNAKELAAEALKAADIKYTRVF